MTLRGEISLQRARLLILTEDDDQSPWLIGAVGSTSVYTYIHGDDTTADDDAVIATPTGRLHKQSKAVPAVVPDPHVFEFEQELRFGVAGSHTGRRLVSVTNNEGETQWFDVTVGLGSLITDAVDLAQLRRVSHDTLVQAAGSTKAMDSFGAIPLVGKQIGFTLKAFDADITGVVIKLADLKGLGPTFTYANMILGGVVTDVQQSSPIALPTIPAGEFLDVTFETLRRVTAEVWIDQAAAGWSQLTWRQ